MLLFFGCWSNSSLLPEAFQLLQNGKHLPPTSAWNASHCCSKLCCQAKAPPACMPSQSLTNMLGIIKSNGHSCQRSFVTASGYLDHKVISSWKQMNCLIFLRESLHTFHWEVDGSCHNSHPHVYTECKGLFRDILCVEHPRAAKIFTFLLNKKYKL